jgi:hypothetical protein
VGYNYGALVSSNIKLIQSVPTEFALIDNFINQINSNINLQETDSTFSILLYCYLYYSNLSHIKCIDRLLPSLDSLTEKVVYSNIEQ